MTRRAPWRLLALPFAVATAIGASPARGDPPTPLTPSRFSFPGSVTSPASAISAGLALADRWLGEEPYANPAGGSGLRVVASGALLRVSRQDLRADNRNYDETSAFFDGAGLTVGLPALGPVASALYAFQPVLRFEDNAYSRGTGAPDPQNPPAVIQASASAREVRAGLALSAAVGPGRVGLGVEWTHREDLYRFVESSGARESGTRRLEFSGDAIGVQAGARLDRGDSSAGALSLGLGARYLPALAVDAIHAETLLVATTNDTLRARRQPGWEAGVSARLAVSPAFRVLATFGGRSAQRWEGFDLGAGRGWEWKLAGEYHDVGDPWTLRLGIGQERQSDVPEPRAGLLGLGFGWQFASAAVDVGVVHRTLARDASPNSFDDRIVLTVRAPR